MRRKNRERTKKVCCSFTEKQLYEIDQVDGKLGSNRAEIIHSIVILYLNRS